MGKTQQIQAEMMKALKQKDTVRKDALSSLLSALKAKAKDKREELSEEEENAVIAREIKQTRETLESAPAGREDIVGECRTRLKIFEEFAPAQLDEAGVRAEIEKVIAELGIGTPAKKDRGQIMKTLMPRVSGRADGAMVNRLVGELLQ